MKIDNTFLKKCLSSLFTYNRWNFQATGKLFAYLKQLKKMFVFLFHISPIEEQKKTEEKDQQ